MLVHRVVAVYLSPTLLLLLTTAPLPPLPSLLLAGRGVVLETKLLVPAEQSVVACGQRRSPRSLALVY